MNELRDRHWHLDCAGSLLRDAPTVAAIQHQIDRLSLRKRVSLLGDLDREALERQYARADVFVLPSYLEGYGMALAEAVAFGLPVVSTTAGAIPETVPANASVLVAPGDSRALAKALASVIDDPARRAALAANARAARASLPTWATAATKFAAALDGLGAQGVSGFSAEWLALREPFDAAARSAALDRGAARAHRAAGTATAPLEVVDLGAGAGSNLRYLAPLLGGEQRWRLVDTIATLLDAALARPTRGPKRAAARCQQRTARRSTVRRRDFVCEVHCEQRRSRGPRGRRVCPRGGLVTAAALLDLVSRQVARQRSRSAAARRARARLASR